jgi:transcriptional regulator GlxA family with amidase domain
MDRQRLWTFADACQVVVGRLEENPGASANLIHDLLAATPDVADAREQAVIDGLAVRMLRCAQSRRGGGARPARMAAFYRGGETGAADGGPAHFKVAHVLTYLEQRFPDPAIRLSSAARHAELSPAHLARLLKASTGLTFLHHLRRFRVRHAERLLLTTMLSIKEIAGQCGYSASGSFDRDFRRMHRCAPSVWRAEHRRREPPPGLPAFFAPATSRTGRV